MNQSNNVKEQSIAQTISFLRSNRPLRAEELCRDYLIQNPGCTEHLRLLSHALMKQNRYLDAEEKLRFAISLSPNYPQLHEDLGSVFAIQSRFEEAIPEFERAIKLQPSLPLVHKKLGHALASVGRGKEADEEFQTYIDSDPNKEAVMKAADLLSEEKTEEAISNLQDILKKTPNDVNAMRYLARAYRQGEKNLQDAEALLRTAVQQAPDFTPGWFDLASLLMRDKIMEAIAAYEKVIQLDPENAAAWGGLGSAYGLAMYPDKSAEAYEKSIELEVLTEHCKNVDILIHDAQYIEADMPLKHGWGHSLISEVTKLGESAEVKNLVYYHHDPERSDDDIDAELETASKTLKENGSSVCPYFAYEGLKLSI